MSRNRTLLTRLAATWRIVSTYVLLVTLAYGVQSHADSEALAASKIAASRAAPACVKLPESAENMVRLECTLDSKRLIIEASGGRTVAVRADAVIF